MSVDMSSDFQWTQLQCRCSVTVHSIDNYLSCVLDVLPLNNYVGRWYAKCGSWMCATWIVGDFYVGCGRWNSHHRRC